MNMQKFKWLHLSDLHLGMCEGFDINLILNQLKKVLMKETEDKSFRYIFITGDLADRYNYSAVEERMKDLLLDSGILEEKGRIFWVCGNHDIPRTLKMRKVVIDAIRDKDDEATFEKEFADKESRGLILGAFEDYNIKREELFGISGAVYPHQVIHTDGAEIVLLNTCLTSCDDMDEHKLYLCDAGLIKLFDEIEPGKPVFALGHHSMDFIADADRKRLLKLFQENNVCLYLCGHSHQLGVRPLTENIREIVSGGFKIDGHAIVSFFIGMFDEGEGEYELTPYTYRFGSRNWGVDYDAAEGTEQGKKYQVSFLPKGSADELSGLITRAQKLFHEADIEKLNINKFNDVGERVLRKYVQNILKGSNGSEMSFAALCEEAVINGNKKINYTSLRMSENRKDVWRFRENLSHILQELGRDDVIFPFIAETPFDFGDFYEKAGRLEARENTYVLVTDAFHDMGYGGKKKLTLFPWDAILDYDGHSMNGGLRSCFSGQNGKDLNHQGIRQAIFRRGITSWIQIGGRMRFSLEKSESGMDLNQIKQFYRETVQKLYENTSGQAIFIFLGDIEIWDMEWMKIAWERFEERARFILVGVYDKKKLDGYFRNMFLDSMGNAATDCYEIFSTSTAQFLKEFEDYADNILEKRAYEARQFPSNRGVEKIDLNLLGNLEDFFEALTSEIGTDLEHWKEEIRTFYLGGEAAWSLFQRKDILETIKSETKDYIIHTLKTMLRAKQEEPRDAVFYFLHEAGYGGTTAAKGIAWKMHKDYPTLLLKNYEYGKIKPLIQNLYDNHSRKGILVIADESRFSASDLESLEHEMCLVDRPFALLIVRRVGEKDRSNIRNAKNAQNVRRLNLLTADMVLGLRERFRAQSHLDGEALKEKDEHFDEVFPKNSGMRCPFFIGLYYQDRWFKGVSGYVERMVSKVDSESELKLLLALGIINYFGRTGATNEIVKKYVPLSAGADYLEKYPYAKDAFIRVYDETKLYQEKHHLLSEEVIKQCSAKLYGGSGYQENLKEILKELIGKILEINNRGITLYYKNLLERLFIYKNATDVNENGLTELTDFSPLVHAIPSQISKEDVMSFLAKGVMKAIDGIAAEGNELYFKMAAHICGHLGRLYRASPASMELLQNSKKSIEWCKEAENIMDRGRFEDAYIYHMHGTSLSKQCSDKLKAWNEQTAKCSDGEIEKLDRDIQEALSKFDQAIYAGEFVRGCVSKLSLLMEYVGFLTKWKGIKSADEMNKFSKRERDYIKDIDDLIGMLEDTALDEKDGHRLQNLKNNYNAEIMFHNYGKAIEYYVNSITNVVREKGEDANELYVLRSGLAGAVLGKYWDEGRNPYVDMQEKDVERILDALEKNIFSTVVLSDRWERQRRCNDCLKWLKVAKQSSVGIKTGIEVAERWRDLQKEAVIKDPRPYYYLTILHYLNAMDGYISSVEAARMNQHESYKIARNNSVFRVVNMEKIQDTFLEGKGMGRIKSIVELTEDLDKIIGKGIRLKGEFQGPADDKNPKIGKIKVVFPQELKNTNVYFKMGDKNTISVNQSNHILEFMVGFTFERMEAINNTVKDVTDMEYGDNEKTI